MRADEVGYLDVRGVQKGGLRGDWWGSALLTPFWRVP